MSRHYLSPVGCIQKYVCNKVQITERFHVVSSSYKSLGQHPCPFAVAAARCLCAKAKMKYIARCRTSDHYTPKHDDTGRLGTLCTYRHVHTCSKRNRHVHVCRKRERERERVCVCVCVRGCVCMCVYICIHGCHCSFLYLLMH